MKFEVGKYYISKFNDTNRVFKYLGCKKHIHYVMDLLIPNMHCSITNNKHRKDNNFPTSNHIFSTDSFTYRNSVEFNHSYLAITKEIEDFVK